MIAYQVGWLKYLPCMTPVWWEREHFSSNQWKTESGLWLWGAEGGLYFPEKSHYYCPANLWLASRENLPTECLSFLLLSYELLISLWSYHPLCAIVITQQPKKNNIYSILCVEWVLLLFSLLYFYDTVSWGISLVKGKLRQNRAPHQQFDPSWRKHLARDKNIFLAFMTENLLTTDILNTHTHTRTFLLFPCWIVMQKNK